ncbi:MAG: anti-sigma factor, partial [Candidatus Acidiferrum sp.]
GELDAVRAAEFERHLENCAECVSALEAQETLGSAVQRAHLNEPAPAALRQKVLADIRASGAARASQPLAMPRRRMQWSWLAAAAALLLLTYAGWRTILALRAENYQSVVAAEIVDAHLRSLQPGHLTDVLSTDQHTVKPWFDGKLDFSPPVQDFATDGFSLQGGRLDVVHGRTIAALIYARRKHLISVFIQPTQENTQIPRSGSQQGYHWTAWRNNGMEFCAISDVSPSDLQQLQQLFGE